MLLTTIDALELREQESLDLLMQITQDRGPLMERIRAEYSTEATNVATSDRGVLLQLTSVFDRVIWMAQRFAQLIEAAPLAGLAAEKAGALEDQPAPTFGAT